MRTKQHIDPRCPFPRKSGNNVFRSSYVTADGSYSWLFQELCEDGTYRTVSKSIQYTEETREYIQYMDEDDHRMDCLQKRDEDHKDHRIEGAGTRSNDMDYDSDPLENIPAKVPEEPSALPEIQLPENFHLEYTASGRFTNRTMEVLRALVLKRIPTDLTDAQKDLYYSHLGEGRQLEEMRREEVARTGVNVSPQAYDHRYQRILGKMEKRIAEYLDMPPQELPTKRVDKKRCSDGQDHSTDSNKEDK